MSEQRGPDDRIFATTKVPDFDPTSTLPPLSIHDSLFTNHENVPNFTGMWLTYCPFPPLIDRRKDFAAHHSRLTFHHSPLAKGPRTSNQNPGTVECTTSHESQPVFEPGSNLFTPGNFEPAIVALSRQNRNKDTSARKG